MSLMFWYPRSTQESQDGFEDGSRWHLKKSKSLTKCASGVRLGVVPCFDPQHLPKQSQDGPAWSQDRLQNAPKMVIDGFQMAPNGPKMAQDCIKMVHNSRMTQNGPKSSKKTKIRL